ncbi:SDR family NAD(P)-dependent oxidoreductase [Rhodococcus sp. G-MC3]|uniref:SDR family NAD(P)-dependent oxidoreductase n=1 Tax=Rhodococcus sp. G-MC3 TaxID=3046209 RepID=UPI0024BAA53D|nr:SDR family NAD(P)-dependent oxidoreductase [Rhodococcus sp. G-MC3]MDJ0396772.1 SDR family NAD(P)-dependent oxidoreductase [Rhodococcus sp. G-MC3]
MKTTTTHTVVMTGASRGIGTIAAGEILRRDPDAHLVVIGRGAEAHSKRTTLIKADLASGAATRAAVARIAESIADGGLPPLSGFVGNAGIQYSNNLVETEERIEATFAVNVRANHLVLRGLESSFGKTARVVVTVSDTHFGDFRHNLAMVPAPAWTSVARLARTEAFPNPKSAHAGRTAYSTSKLAAIYLVHAWSRRLPHVVSFNPGFVPGTDLARNANALSRFAVKRILPAMTWTPVASTPARSGRALADVVLGTIATTNGDYVDRTPVTRSSDESYDTEREQELWDFLDTTPPTS